MALPPIEDILFKTPLYEKLALTEADARTVYRLRHDDDLQIDAPCLDCGRERLFNTVGGSSGYFDRSIAAVYLTDDAFAAEFRCTRDEKHLLRFHFVIANGVLIKVGQWPSLADLAAPELKIYRKMLGEDRYRELSRAIGLAAHGANIGACTYLRRVFESLLEDHRKAMEEAGTASPGYAAAKVPERVKMLAASLPPFLVENAHLYGILSAGIHELDEDTCGRFFPVLKDSIMRILLQDYQARQTRLADEKLARDLNKISTELGAPATAK